MRAKRVFNTRWRPIKSFENIEGKVDFAKISGKSQVTVVLEGKKKTFNTSCKALGGSMMTRTRSASKGTDCLLVAEDRGRQL